MNKKTLVVLGVVGVALLVCVFLVSRALPGSALYGVKVGIMETATGYGYRSASAQVERQLDLLDRRLDETAKLAAKRAVSERASAALLAETQAHTQAVIDLLGAETDRALTPTESLMYALRLSSILWVQEHLVVDADTFTSIEDDLNDLVHAARQNFDDRATQFVLRGTDEEVRSVLQELLTELSAVLGDTTLSDRAHTRVQSYIDRVGQHVTGGNIGRALGTIGDALRFVATERYLSTHEGNGNESVSNDEGVDNVDEGETSQVE